MPKWVQQCHINVLKANNRNTALGAAFMLHTQNSDEAPVFSHSTIKGCILIG
jgi:hypothetical protein